MTDSSTTAALVAVIIILSKIIEVLWNKYKPKSDSDHATVKLHHDQDRRLREVHEKILLLERDINDMKIDSDSIAKAMNKLAECMKNVSETNHKVAELVAKIDRRQEIEEEVHKRMVTVSGVSSIER